MGDYNQDIQKAVRHLYGAGVIESDKDIADRTKLSKGTVSSYIKGNIRASKKFRTEFEQVFKLSLKDFAGDANGTAISPAADLRDQLLSEKERRIQAQEREINSLNDRIEDLKTRLATSLNELEEYAKVNAAHVLTISRCISEHRAKMEKVSLDKILDEHRKFFDEEMLNILNKGR